MISDHIMCRRVEDDILYGLQIVVGGLLNLPFDLATFLMGQFSGQRTWEVRTRTSCPAPHGVAYGRSTRESFWNAILMSSS